MYTCQHCKQKFNNVPYLCCTNGRKYCSLQCFPDSGIDDPYSSMYFNLIETIRDIDSRISGIVLLEGRIELENEVNELATSSFLETYGDNEGLFYKVQIEYLISTLDDLYDKIHDLFMKRKPQLKHGVEIYPDELQQIVGEEATALVELEENLKYSSLKIYIGKRLLPISLLRSGALSWPFPRQENAKILNVSLKSLSTNTEVN